MTNPEIQKKRRTQLTQATRLAIANDLRNGSTVASVMQKYHVSRRTVYNIKRYSARIRAMSEKHNNLNAYRQRQAKYPDIEQRVLLFLSAARAMKLPITANFIKIKATQIHSQQMAKGSDEIKRKIQNFKASDGWVQKFVSRHKIRSVILLGQGRSVNIEDVSKGIADLRNQLRSFEPQFIFSVDEAGLFYRLLPRKTYTVLNDENRKTVHGLKNMQAKDRITGYICTNATGTLKLPIGVIGVSESPVCFRKQSPPLPYFAQQNAWSDSVTFRKWFYTVFLPFVRKHSNSKVALITDNCSAHGDLRDNRNQVQIFTLPPNSSTVHQPMTCGVIAAFKLRYRHTLVDELLVSFEDHELRRNNAKNMAAGTKGLAEGHEPHVLDAIEIVARSWELVSEATVARCWLKAGILPSDMQVHVESMHGKTTKCPTDEDSKLAEELFARIRKLSQCPMEQGEADGLSSLSKMDVQDWVSIESNDAVQEATVEDVWADCIGYGEDDAQIASCVTNVPQGAADTVTVSASALPGAGAISTLFAPLEGLSMNAGLDGIAMLLRSAKQEMIRASLVQALERQKQVTLEDL